MQYREAWRAGAATASEVKARQMLLTHTRTHTSKQRKHTKKKLRKKDNHKFNIHCKEHGSPIH